MKQITSKQKKLNKLIALFKGNYPNLYKSIGSYNVRHFLSGIV